MAIQKGTGFTNLNRVLQASRGNRLGQTISGGIQEQTKGVQTQVKSAQEQFEEEAQKGRLDTGEAAQKRSEILGRFAPSTGAASVQQQPVTPQAGAQPAPGTQPNQVQSPVSEQEIQDFTKFRTGTYTGPKQLQDVQTLTGRAQQAEQLGGLARSEGGRQELLRRFVGGTGYTPGQRQLDTTLLGQQPGQLGQAAREARGASGLVERAAGTAAGLAQEYAGRAKGFGEETQRLVGETREPISQALEQRVTAAQQAEQTRQKEFQNIKNVLAGTDAQFKGLDPVARLGLGLQQVANMGYLTPEQTQQLIGQGGLVQRGMALGLDVNQLVGERLQDIIAQNLGRGGIATEEERSRLTALERLAGEQGADLEFGQPGQAFQAGRIGLDTAGLEDYIRKTEDERAARDAKYAADLAAERARYLNQIQAGLGQAVTGGQQAVGSALGVLGVLEDPTDAFNITGDAVGGTVKGSLDAVSGATAAGIQTPAALIEGLAKLNIGGSSIANTEGGRQLLKLVDVYSKLGNVTPQAVSNLGTMYQDVFSDVGRGNILGAVGSVGSGIGKTIGGAIKSIGGSGIKISDEDLKTDVDYSPEDLQRFMDRIKPAAYNYKDEVKDSPLASKNRELGVMAQDLEKSELGKEAVKDTEMGKVVDYDNLEPKMLASIAALNKRLKELETKK